ncbi:hypothetical protein [Candidatus Laterigemmans baculatus]|uniref:hypothetical protein n=1 Tax=Candidatus Laterigemmans baculatus TaxID=2770505 RepID=UPI0013DC5918|nr:hypothetical protein [Candidatus Laterigemmans baculatus]
MEETAIPPLLGVVGHPIAGNPMQFAMERALAAANLEWRFLSFDVPPERLAAAVAGVDALGFRGLAVAPPHSAAVLELVPRHSQSARIGRWADAIHRGDDGCLIADNLLGDALRDLLGDRPVAGSSVGLLGDVPESRALFATLSLLAPKTLWVRDIAAENFSRSLEAHRPAAPLATDQSQTGSGEPEAGESRSELSTGRPAAARASQAEGGSEPAEHGSFGHPQGPSEPPDAAPVERTTGPADGERDEQAERRPRGAEGDAAEPPQVLKLSDRDKAAFGELQVLVRGGLTPTTAGGAADAKMLEKQVEQLRQDCVVVDLAVCASTSPLLRTASERGLPTISAIDLLVARAALAFHRWTGRRADRLALQEAFEEYLEI